MTARRYAARLALLVVCLVLGAILIEILRPQWTP